ncbi:hypothetical protein QQP08_023037, partial [Theobroma cacao]
MDDFDCLTSEPRLIEKEMKQGKGSENIFLALLFHVFSVVSGRIWLTILQLEMDAKHPKENQSKILMLLASNLMVGIVIGLFLPLIIATGLVSLSFFFNYPMPPESELNSSDNAECKETRFPTWFTASACILCWILVPIPWKLLNDYCGKLLKHPEENAFLAFVQLALFCFGLCSKSAREEKEHICLNGGSMILKFMTLIESKFSIVSGDKFLLLYLN